MQNQNPLHEPSPNGIPAEFEATFRDLFLFRLLVALAQPTSASRTILHAGGDPAPLFSCFSILLCHAGE